jgi:hypothetical protein
MTPLIELLATFKPPDGILKHLNEFTKGKKISAEAQRWLSVWKHWDAWLEELEAIATDDDQRLLEDLAKMFDGVEITEIKQATLIEVKDKPTI